VADVPALRQLVAAAFTPPPETGAVRAEAPTTPPEVELVESLRGSAAWLPELAMVAEAGGELVAYALLSRVHLDPSGFPALALGPVAVPPRHQRQGYGTEVVQAVLDAATELGERLVVVLGDPTYYRRFGFEPAIRLGLTSPWSGLGDPWQALVLPEVVSGAEPVPAGEVIYPEPWFRV
jgi:putative acetyltransferase